MEEKETGRRWELCTPCVANLRKGLTSGMRNFMMCAMSSAGSCSILEEGTAFAPLAFFRSSLRS